MKSSYFKDEKHVEKKIIEKYLKSGFESLSLEELAITIINASFERSYKSQTGTEWPKEYKKKALERLKKAKFNIQWSLNQNKKNIPMHSKFKEIINICEKDNEQKLNEIFRENAQYMQEIINTVDDNKKSLLHISSKRGNVKMIKFLITKGFSIFSRDKYLRTPFLISCQFGRLKAAEELLNYGSEIFAKDSIGRTCLHYAVCSDSSLLVKLIIEKEKSLIFSKDTYGRTPLHYVIFNSNSFQVEMAKMLIDNGSEINCLDEENMTPLHFAAENGKGKIIPILMKSGADPLLTCNRDNKNSLDLACNERIRELIIKFSNGEYQNDINQKKLRGKVENDGFHNKSNGNSFRNGRRNNYNGNNEYNFDYNDDLMYNTNRNKLISFLKNIQDYGVKTQQHLVKPELYSGSWLEKVNNINELYKFFGNYTPHESALAIYNIMIPFVNPLPKSKDGEQNMNLFFNKPKKGGFQIQSSNNIISSNNNIGISSIQNFSQQGYYPNNTNNTNVNDINTGTNVKDINVNNVNDINVGTNVNNNYNYYDEDMDDMHILNEQRREILDLKNQINDLSKKIEEEKKNKERADVIKVKLEIEKVKNENEMLKNQEENLSSQINILSDNIKKYEELTSKLEEKEQIQKDTIINHLNSQLQDMNYKIEQMKNIKINNVQTTRFRNNSPSYRTFLPERNLNLNEEMHILTFCQLAEKDEGLFEILIKFDKDNDMHIFKNEFLEVLDYLNLPFEHRDSVIKLIGFENNMKLPINKIVNLLYNRDESKVCLLNKCLFNIANKIIDVGKNIDDLFNDLNNKAQGNIINYEDAAPIFINNYFIREEDVYNLFNYWASTDSMLMNSLSKNSSNTINNTIDIESFKNKIEERKKIIDYIDEKYGKQQNQFKNTIIINQNLNETDRNKQNGNYHTFSNNNNSNSNSNSNSNNNNNITNKSDVYKSDIYKSDIYKSDIYKTDNDKTNKINKSNYQNLHDEEPVIKNEDIIKKQIKDEEEYYNEFENDDIENNNNIQSNNNQIGENYSNDEVNENSNMRNVEEEENEKDEIVNKKESNELIESNEVEDSELSKIKSKNTTSSILEVSNINEKLINSTLKKSSSSSNKTKTYKNNNSNINEDEEIENEELSKSKQQNIKNKKQTPSKKIKINPNEKFNGELKIQVKDVENLTLSKNLKSPYTFNLKLSIEGIDQTTSSKEITTDDLNDITFNWSTRILLKDRTLKDIGSIFKISLETNLNNKTVNLGERSINWINCLNKQNYDQYVIDEKSLLLNKKHKPIGYIKIMAKFIPFGFNSSNYEKNGKRKKPGTSNNTIKEESISESQVSKIKTTKDHNIEDNKSKSISSDEMTLIKEFDIEINSISNVENDNMYLYIISKINEEENEIYSSKDDINIKDIINKIPFTLKATSYSTSKEKNIQLIIQFKKNEDDSIICEGNVNLNNKENNLTISKKIKLSGEENVEMNVKITINTTREND